MLDFKLNFFYSVAYMIKVIPVASGKGGTGKTLLTSNLGVALAKKKKTVVLIDLDLGCSNLHTCLGIKNNNPGIGSIVHKQEGKLESLLVPTDIPRLHFIPGDSLLPATANMDYFTKQKIIKGILSLPADYVLLDLSAGTQYNVVDFFLLSSSGIIVTTPETTAILNAYSFLKTLVYRLLFRSFPAKSAERERVRDFLSHRIEGSEKKLGDLLFQLKSLNPEAAEKGIRQIKALLPRVVLNMGSGPLDGRVARNLRHIVYRNLGVYLEFIGYILREEGLSSSIAKRTPQYILAPESSYSRSISALGDKLINYTPPRGPVLFESDEDLKAVMTPGR